MQAHMFGEKDVH